MQVHQNHQGRFSGIWTGKLPETPRSLQKGAEGLSGGAAKRCYGKCKSVLNAIAESYT